jgi:hypothetical protein
MPQRCWQRRPPNWAFSLLRSVRAARHRDSPIITSLYPARVRSLCRITLSESTLNYALVLIVLSVSCSKKERIESLEKADRTMRSDRLPVPSPYGLQTSSALHSESKNLDFLRLENKQLRGLVIHLSQIVFKNVMEAQRPRSDCSPIAPSEPPVCSPTMQPFSAPSLWLSG